MFERDFLDNSTFTTSAVPSATTITIQSITEAMKAMEPLRAMKERERKACIRDRVPEPTLFMSRLTFNRFKAQYPHIPPTELGGFDGMAVEFDNTLADGVIERKGFAD